jgi:ABC-type uncharacterized transport system involved in gliding motility auxiliary subunit
MKVASPAPQGLTTTAVLESSAASMAVPFAGGGEGEDGPFALVAAAERGGEATPGATSPSEMRVVFIATGRLADDKTFDLYANSDLFLSAINWTAGNDLLVSIPPKEPVRNTLTMPANVRRFTVLFSLSVLPFVVLLLGGVMWLKRR